MDSGIMITGSTGNLGRELMRLFPNSLHPTHEDLELSDREEVYKFIKNSDVGIIIHTAALTNIRRCEENIELAWKNNLQATENLVDSCLKYRPTVYFVYMSTACVFDGHRGMYTENDTPYPENFYALTKLLGEFVVKKLDSHLIVRTNFVAKEKWKYPKAFTDRYGTYLLAEDVALGIKNALDRRVQNIIHIVGESKMSMFELARKLSPDVRPMTIHDYEGPSLTMDMSLDTIRWRKYSISL